MVRIWYRTKYHHDEVIICKHFPRYWPFVLIEFPGESTVIGGFPSQMPVKRSFDVFFDLCLDKQSSKQSRCRWFETPSHLLWRHCNDCSRLGGRKEQRYQGPWSQYGDRTVALNIIARCSITQTPTGQSKVWWLHARKMVVNYSKRI